MKEERNYTVYLHVCKENNKTYVGMTCQEVERRWRNGNGYKDNTYFKNAIEKYTWDGFEHVVLFENKTQLEAEELEILFIKILLSNNRTYGYNIENGGNSTGKHSEETRNNISKAKKGKKLSEEAKASLKEKRKKYIHPSSKRVHCDGRIFNNGKECAEFYGINQKILNNWLRGRNGMPQEFFDKGLKYIDETYEIKVQTDNIGENNPNSKKVICDDVIYNSLTEFSDVCGFGESTLSFWLNGKTPMPQKFIDLNLRYLGSDMIFQPQKGFKGGNNPIAKKIICDGIIYDCIGDCAEHYGIGRRLLNDWLLKPHRKPQQFIDMGLDYYIEN